MFRLIKDIRSMMCLWVFDRSGPCNSEKFDIHKEPEPFAKVLAGYGLSHEIFWILSLIWD
jgi:hypothetical protein